MSPADPLADTLSMEERAAFYHAPVGMAISKMRDGRPAQMLAINDALCELLGYSREEIIGGGADQFTHPDDVQGDIDFHRRLQAGEARSLERDKRYVRADGTVVWCRLNLSLMPITDGMAVLATVIDLTEARSLRADLQRRGLEDPLTGLANRAALTTHLRAVTRGAHAIDRPIALLYLDLDDFKRTNDWAGHHVGDALLGRVADVLRQECAEEDFPARIGGDEFAVVYRIPSDNGPVDLPRRISAAISAPVEAGDRVMRASCCIGVAHAGPDTNTAEDLLRAADVALRRAKQERRSTLAARLQPGEGIEVYDEGLRRQEIERRRRREALESALAEDRVEVRFQPIMSLPLGRLAGVEALVRLKRRDGGLTLPWEFIGTAEETGLIIPLGRAVRRRACAEWAGMVARLGRPIGLSLNVSTRELDDPAFLSELEEALRAHGVASEHVCVEITETALLRPGRRTDEVLHGVRAMGLSLSIDDFGAGYTSLGYLATLPVNELKLDRSYVAHLPGSRQASAFARAIFGMGDDLGVRTVAEGIESAEQAAACAELGADFAQGYHYGRPMRSTDITEA